MREIDFMPVGESHGDAICIRYGDPQGRVSVNVIDGGYTEVGDKIVNHVSVVYGTDQVDNVLLTHADNDHARGLIPVLTHLRVGAVYMNKPWDYAASALPFHHGNYGLAGLIADIKAAHPYLVELEQIAAKKNIPIYPALQGTTFGAFKVLAPSRARYGALVPLLDKTPQIYGEPKTRSVFERVTQRLLSMAEDWNIETLSDNPAPTSHSNETSTVVLFEYDNYSALFTGDVGPQGLIDAFLNSGVRLASPLSLFQIPHQGSRRNLTPLALNAWLGPKESDPTVNRGNAYCTVGSNKSDYPRRVVSNAIARRGYTVQAGRTDNPTLFSDVGRPGYSQLATIPFYSHVEDYT